jgi:hypothetical protein
MSPNKSKRTIAQKLVIVSNQKKNSADVTSGKKEVVQPNQMLKKNIAKLMQNPQKSSFGNRRGSTLVLKHDEMNHVSSVERNKQIGPKEIEQILRSES